MFEPSLISWRAQYARMLRGFEKLQRSYGSSVEYGDDLQHFLQDCWHLKDWIATDPASGIHAPDIEREVHAIDTLRVVGDLATACKHFNHDRTNRADAYVAGNDVTVGARLELVYRITTKYGDTTAAQLVPDAVAAWDELLRKLRLIQ